MIPGQPAMPPQPAGPGAQPAMPPQAGGPPPPAQGSTVGKMDQNNPLTALMVRRFEGLSEDEAETLASDMTPALASVLSKVLPEVARVFAEAVTYQGEERGMMPDQQPGAPQPAAPPQPQGQPMPGQPGQVRPPQQSGRLNTVSV